MWSNWKAFDRQFPRSFFGAQPRRRRPKSQPRQRFFESLETRQMLAAAPVVPLTTTTKFADGSITALSPISVSEDTSDKPQSKLWMNEGHWWSVMPDSSGTWIWRLDGTQWSHVLQLAAGNSFHADVYSQGDVAQILLRDSSNPANSKLASVEYVAGGLGSYELWTARPSLVTIPLAGSDETATLTVDSTGRMWVASDVTSTIEVRYSDFPYLSFSSPITIGSGINSDDISDITAMPNGQIGVLWSNQNTKRFYFRTHTDGADPTDWSAAELPAAQSAQNVGGGMADDHLHMAVASDGTIYAAVKTSYDSSGQPKMALLIRRPNGVWDRLYEVDGSGTRPNVLLDEAIGRLMVVYTTSEAGGSIVYKETALSSISFSPRITLISGTNNNVTTTKQNVTDQIVVMAGSGGSAKSALLTIPLPSGSGQTAQPIVASAGADQIIQLPAGITLHGTVSSGGSVLPSNATTHTWSITSGPGAVSIADASSFDTTATFGAPGTYILRLTADDGNGPVFDELTVVVNPVPPVGSLPITVSFQDGNGYSGTRDTTITAGSPTKNQGSKASVTLDGSPDIAGLLRWDIRSIPQGAVVQAVSITLNVTNTAKQSYQLYDLKQDWTELGATFRKSSATSNWGAAGALGAADRGSIVLGTLTATAKGKVTITLNAAGIAVVQNWINSPGSNFGFIFQNYANANTALTFDSREAKTVGNRPKLSISYAIPVLVAAAGDDQEIQQTDAAPLHGTATYTVAPNPTRPLSISWTLISGPGNVTFGDSTALDTDATFDTAGTYVLRLTLNDGIQTVLDELTIIVDPAAVI